MGRTAIVEIRLRQTLCLISRNEPGLLKRLKQTNHVRPYREFSVLTGVRQHKVLHHKFNIDNTTWVALEIEMIAPFRRGCVLCTPLTR